MLNIFSSIRLTINCCNIIRNQDFQHRREKVYLTKSRSLFFKRYYIVTEYISHTVYFIPVTHLFCNWKFVPLSVPHLFLFFPHHLWQPPLLCIHNSASVLLYLFICFVF